MSNADRSRLPEYSIAAVSKLTGVSCHALRVWERRYGFPTPHRSESGHRRYSADQVEALRQIVRQVESGGSIREVIGAFQSGAIAPTAPARNRRAEDHLSHVALIDQLFVADIESAEEIYQHERERLSPQGLIDRLIVPAIVESGERWFRSEGAIYQERCATGFLLRKLSCLIDTAQRANVHPQHKALVGTTRGERHEGGMLIVSLLLELAGWRAVSIGVDTPALEIQHAVERFQPDALFVSFVLSRNIRKRFLELSKIKNVPVFIGGRSILNYQGLAKRFGLIAMPGPATLTVEQIRDRYEEWQRQHVRSS